MKDSSRLYTIVTGVLEALFKREEAFITKQQLAIIERNAAKGGSPDGFRHLGQIYTNLVGASVGRGSYKHLPPDLGRDMDRLLKEQSLLNSEKARVQQALVMVLRPCESWQDIRDALPNGLTDLVPECKGLPRTRPEAFTLEDKPRDHQQYMAIREKIEVQIASQLLY